MPLGAVLTIEVAPGRSFQRPFVRCCVVPVGLAGSSDEPRRRPDDDAGADAQALQYAEALRAGIGGLALEHPGGGLLAAAGLKH